MSKGQNFGKGQPQSRAKSPVPSSGDHELRAGNLLAGTPRPCPGPGDLPACDLAASPPSCLLQDQTDGSWRRTGSHFWSPEQVWFFPAQENEVKVGVGVTNGQSTMNFSRSRSSSQQGHQETRKNSEHTSCSGRTSVGSDVNGSSSESTMNLNISLTGAMHQAYLEFLWLLTMLIYFMENIFKLKLLDLIILLYKISHKFPFKSKATLRKMKQ